MATIKQMLANLTPEQLDALEQEFLSAQANGGNLPGKNAVGGMDSMNPSGRTTLLPSSGGLSSRIGRGILSGAQAAGESIVRDVRQMAGFKDTSSELKNFIAKEQIKNQIRKGKASSEFNIQNDVEVPEGYEIAGYDQKGQPMIRKIKANIAEEKLNIEQDEKKKAQEEKSQFVKESALDTLKTIGEVEKGIGHFGLTGQLPSIPGTERATWEANVNKLLSGKIINLMTQMKEASKTGATGFGQLSEKELKVLQEASTALKRGLSPEAAQAILNDMKIKIKKIAGEESAGGNAGVTSSGVKFTVE